MLRTFMNSVWPWPLTSISKLYFHHEFESDKMSLLFDIGIWNFGIWVYHHETTCCVYFCTWWDLDLWPMCGWQGVSLASFTHIFYFVSSPELKAQMSFSDKNLSVVHRCCRHWRRHCSKLFTFSSSPPKPLGQFQPNLAQIIL